MDKGGMSGEKECCQEDLKTFAVNVDDITVPMTQLIFPGAQAECLKGGGWSFPLNLLYAGNSGSFADPTPRSPGTPRSLSRRALRVEEVRPEDFVESIGENGRRVFSKVFLIQHAERFSTLNDQRLVNS
ncbi:hypothetical protein NDN08_003812 [Rhodosorus marinus]|uniref:Uncharacterized protein n=1 Tax=Rhodosorus marinus TaxID=101924 RepID=A0AAV8UGJ8_9RHOD|nr:hypothetical protein NDN08_003812 [Rhodosorus marinus]